MPKQIYLVGHCSPDSSYLTQTIKAVAPDAAVKRVNDEPSLNVALASQPDLLLVNRQLDGVFDTYEGLQLIARVHAQHPSLKLMMISNYPDALAAAQKAGALPGFGKAEQHTPETRQRIRVALGL